MLPIIDPEFRDLIPPLSKEEYAGLEASLKEFGCHTAIVTWNGIIIDGHNRFEICTKYGIEFDELEWPFKDRREARIWILDNQLSRRNISEIVRMDMALLMKSEIQAQAQERKKATQFGSTVGPISDPPAKTDAVLAAKAGVGKTKLREYEHVKDTATPELLQATRDGKVSVHAAAQAVKSLTPAEQIEVLKSTPGKVGKAITKVVNEVEAKKKEIEETNKWIDETNSKMRGKDFDPIKERARMQTEGKIYNAFALILELPDPVEALATISPQCEYRLGDIDAAVTWVTDFYKLYKESRKNEAV